MAAYAAYYCGDVLASIIAIKGRPGAAELSGSAPFAGVDGLALDKAFGRLGWGYGSQNTRIWLGILLTPFDHPPLENNQLRVVCEIVDPLVIVSLDEPARLALIDAFDLERIDLPADFQSGSQTSVFGRNFVSISGFEDSLSDEGAKQRVWAELKRCKLPG